MRGLYGCAGAAAVAGVVGGLAYLGTSPAPATAVPAPHRQTVHYADVDGDGRADRVTITFPSREGSFYKGYARLVVEYAAGGGARHYWQVGGWPTYGRNDGDLWVGATQLDHVRGHELIVGKASGANWQRYVVLTLHGRLERLPPPSDRYGWLSHGSAGGGSQAVTCTRRGVGFNSLVSPTGPGRPAHEVDQRFVWKNGDWRRTFLHRFATRDPDLAKFRMWNGCPRMQLVRRSSSYGSTSV